MDFKAIVRRRFIPGGTVTQTLLIMKFTAFFLLVACLQVSAKGYAQRVTLSEKNVTLQKIFRQIQKQTAYDFLYSPELLQQAGKISIDVHNADLEQVLQYCFKDKPLTYVLMENTIVIKPKPPVSPGVVTGVEAVAPDPITGVVVDETGKPLQAVSVVIKWTTSSTGLYRSPTGTQTNERGEFILPAATGSGTMYISSIGFADVQLPVNAKTGRLRIVLKPSETNLKDLVVTGYSTKKISEITGSVQTLSGTEVRNGVSTANTLAMLKGKVAGLYIVETGNSNGSVANKGQVIM